MAQILILRIEVDPEKGIIDLKSINHRNQNISQIYYDAKEEFNKNYASIYKRLKQKFYIIRIVEFNSKFYIGDENDRKFPSPQEVFVSNDNSRLSSSTTIDKKMTFLLDTEFLFAQDEYEYRKEKVVVKSEPQIHPFVPTINICDKNLLDKSAQDQISSFRYSNILDSSIWNYFCHSEENLHTKKLANIFANILNNYSIGLYNLAISYEYADLNFRLLREDFISGNAHGSAVIPFLFHSEWESKHKIQEEYLTTEQVSNLSMFTSILKKDKSIQENINTNTNLQIRNHKWRILLVDDKNGRCEDHQSPSRYLSLPEKDVNGNSKLSKISKLDILKADLEYIFPNQVAIILEDRITLSDTYKQAIIYIDTVATKEAALQKLKEYQYEIILLDYLLDIEKNNVKYGYQILKSIKDDQNDFKTQKKTTPIYLYGPHKRLYFMFISAFTTAVNERLLAEGLHKSEDYWHIADGACPTNTPYLFLYNLLHLMSKRLEDSGIRKLDLTQIVDLMGEIFDGIAYSKTSIKDKSHNVRKAANDKFDKVLSLLYHYKTLMEDVEDYEEEKLFATKGSVLVTHFMKKRPYLGGLLEHLTQLVYLTAFGTIRQWPEMWNEYLYIRAIIEAEKTQPENVTITTSLDNALLAIESYITQLKAGTLS